MQWVLHTRMIMVYFCFLFFVFFFCRNSELWLFNVMSVTLPLVCKGQAKGPWKQKKNWLMKRKVTQNVVIVVVLVTTVERAHFHYFYNYVTLCCCLFFSFVRRKYFLFVWLKPFDNKPLFLSIHFKSIHVTLL